MPVTSDNLDRAVLSGTNQFKNWEQKFSNQWNYTANQVALAQFWRGLPQIVRLKLRELDPKAADEMDQKFGGRYATRRSSP